MAAANVWVLPFGFRIDRSEHRATKHDRACSDWGLAPRSARAGVERAFDWVPAPLLLCLRRPARYFDSASRNSGGVSDAI